MYYLLLVRLLVIVFMVTTVLLEVFPDKTVIWTTNDQHLFYSDEVEAWTSAQISPGQFAQTISIVPLNNLGSVYGIAADTPTKQMVLSDKGGQSLAIMDLDSKFSTFFHFGTSMDIGQLSIDWLGHNVYWADTGYGWIAMKKLPDDISRHNSLIPDFRVVVDQDLERPTGVVVHPEKFYLFWTNTGQTPTIERSDLIGGNRKIIVWQSLITPTTLCIDQSTNRLYWTDPRRGTIEYSDFDGNDRKILLSDPDIGFYGIAVFQDSLIYTAPSHNRTGYVSLRENNEGQHIQASLAVDVTLYHVLVYASELQENQPDNALCDTVQECGQMCLYMEHDAGFTCLCDDGYELVSGTQCSAEGQVLERYIIFTNANKICAIALSVLGLRVPTSAYLDVHCDIVTEETIITRFALDMSKKTVFYTNGTAIYKQEAFTENKTMLYHSDGLITDLDYNWKTRQLFWVESEDGYLYYINASGEDSTNPERKQLSEAAVTNIAVDPHNRKVFWIVKNSGSYSLYVWDIAIDQTELIQTSLLVKPSDLEYDRPKDRLLWLDNEGHVGIINTDGTHERKYSMETSGQNRHAISAYKNFILASTAENRQFDVIYELEPNAQMHMTLHKAYNGPVLDLHVYESTLQPSDLEPCEVDNGGCEHICLHGNKQQCACFVGYILDTDNTSCQTVILEEDYFVLLDTIHNKLYQVEMSTGTPYAIEIEESNKPRELAYDPTTKSVIWIDADKLAVKKKKIGSPEETAMWSGVDDGASITVDVSTGNMYISTGGAIIAVSATGDKTTIIDETKIHGTVGKITVISESGLMAWLEIGNSMRIVLSDMDGSNPRPISVDMAEPMDIAFDQNNEKGLYWCDSELDKIELIDTQSLSTTIIYEGRGLRPVAMDVVGDNLYFVPKNQRQILQINKNTGLGQSVFLESPLFGSLSNFFFARKMTGHELCSNCNGGCSNICLPIGKNKRCACADGIGLKADELLCQFADVCPEESYVSKPGLKSLTECCPSFPNAVCKPLCEDGYQRAASVVTCRSGKWNVSLDNVCEAPGSDPLPITYIAAGAGGGAALIVVVIVVIVCLCRRGRAHKGGEHSRNGHGRMLTRDYETANGVLSPDPPRRKPEPEVYDYLKEDEMVDVSKLRVSMPPMGEDNDKKITRANSNHSGRYSAFPGPDYLTIYESREIEPKPDYNEDYDNMRGEGPDGYLRSSSVSGASLRDASDGSFGTMTYHDSSHGNRKSSDFRNIDLPTVKYTSGSRGGSGDGRMFIMNQSGRNSRNTERDVRHSSLGMSGGHTSLSGSFGYSGHI